MASEIGRPTLIPRAPGVVAPAPVPPPVGDKGGQGKPQGRQRDKRPKTPADGNEGRGTQGSGATDGKEHDLDIVV